MALSRLFGFGKDAEAGQVEMERLREFAKNDGGPAFGGKRYICFQVCGRYFALPQEIVREMMPLQTPLPLGGDRPDVLGVIHSKHRQIPVVDLTAKLKLKKQFRRRPSRMIVARVGGYREVAFQVDTISDSVEVLAHEIKAGVIQGYGRPKTVLNLEELVTAAELELFG